MPARRINTYVHKASVINVLDRHVEGRGSHPTIYCGPIVRKYLMEMRGDQLTNL